MALCFFAAVPLAGCTSSLFISPANDVAIDAEKIDSKDTVGVRLIRDITTPWGTNFVVLEAPALVMGLNDTGSDPPPSPQRSALVSDMQARNVKKPNEWLAKPSTSLVLVRGYLPPGVRKGDRFDIEVRVPRKSETTGLRNAWLMETRLREVAVLDSMLRTGHTEAKAEGQVIIDAVFQGNDDELSEVRGRVLGGAVSLTSRPLGLAVRGENHSIKTSSLIGAAINARFHARRRGVKRGVATPKRDNYIELEVHPRYKHNLARYIRVVQSIALSESPAERVRRLQRLEQQLLAPSTSANAALQLEAIGKEAMPVLERAIVSENPEVRFYAAEALAYLDGADAAGPLADAAKSEPAFRWHAIAALAAMDHPNARDALISLFDVPSAETRYAAFRALRTKNPMDPLVRGEQFGDHFTYHTISTSGPTMVHCARSRRPEIVVFGKDLRVQPPGFLYAGKDIMLKAAGQDRIKVIGFDLGEEDREEYCSTRLDDVVRTIVKAGGDYGAVLQCLNEANRREYLDTRVVVDALPRKGRVYKREATDEGHFERHAASPLPEMFTNLLTSSDNSDEGKSEEDESTAGPEGTENDDGYLKKFAELFVKE